MTRLRYLDKARVSELMSSPVETLTAHQSLPLAEALMRRDRIRHLPVVDAEGVLVGLVTHRNVLSAKLSDQSGWSDKERTTFEKPIAVSAIMHTDVWTVTSDTLAIKAAHMLRDHAYGCLPVTEEGKLVGILTEADFIDAIADGEHDEPLEQPTVADAMTSSPLSLALPATVGDARAFLKEHGIRHLPLAAAGELVGIVTARDLRIADSIAGGENIALGLIGTEPPHVVDAETPLHMVLSDMADERRGSAMVTQDDVLVGILTTTDACRYLAEWLRAEFPLT